MIKKDVGPDVVESKLRSLLQRVLAAWERGDGRALAAEFADDGDIVFFEGSCLQGRDQIAAVMQHLFETTLRGTRCLAQVKALRFVTPEVALIQTLGGVAFPEETVCPVGGLWWWPSLRRWGSLPPSWPGLSRPGPSRPPSRWRSSSLVPTPSCAPWIQSAGWTSPGRPFWPWSTRSSTYRGPPRSPL